MKTPHRSSLLATLLLISLVALPWAVCASPARGRSEEHPLSRGDAPTVVITGVVATPLGCDSMVVDSIVNPSQPDFYSITIPTDQVISVSVVPIAPVNQGFEPAWRIRDHLMNPISGQYGSFNVRLAHTLVGPLPASGSPYLLDVEDLGQNATGSYAVGFSRVTQGKTCESFDLACDVPHPDSLVSIIDSDLFRFSATDGETVSVTVVGEPPVLAAWRLLKADGTAVPGFENLYPRGAATDCGPLSAAGSPYRIQVADFSSEATGRYRVYMQRLTALTACEGTGLTCDAGVSDSLQSPVDTDLYSFSVTNGEVVSVTVVGEPPVQAAWRLLKGSGAPVPGFEYPGVRPAATICGPLSAAGNPYRIEVADAGGDDSGRYRVYMERLTALTACESKRLPCDTVIVAEALTDSVATNLYRFDANGDVVSISVTPKPGGDPYFEPAWRVIDRAGMPVVGFGGGLNPYYGYPVTVGPLSVAGNPYRVQVGDSGTDATGEYDVRLERLTAGAACEGTSLACDVVVSDSLQNREDSDLFSFSATNGEIVSVTVVGDPPVQATWRLLAGSGTPVPGFEGFAARAAGTDCVPLSSGGNPYRIEVADAAHAIGRYHVYLQRVTALSACENRVLQCGEIVTGSTENSLDTDLLSFNVVAGERVWVSVYERPGSGSQYEPVWRLLDASGNPAGSLGYFAQWGAHADCGILSPFVNPYVIQVGDAGQNDVGQYEVVVDCTRTTAVEETASSTFELGQNRPNPFTPQTTIPFALAFPVHVSLKVYDVSGAEVATLADGDMRPGFHNIPWDARGLRSGVYFYKIRAGSFVRTKQLMIVR